MKTIRFILFFIFVFFLVTPVRGGETIDIAAIYALTGPAADANALTLKGVGYAVDEINKEGGVSGRKITAANWMTLRTPDQVLDLNDPFAYNATWRPVKKSL